MEGTAATVFVIMVAALVMMSAGVWGARSSDTLRKWHVAAVWAALGFAVASTALCPLAFRGVTLQLLMVGAVVGLTMLVVTALLGTQAIRSPDSEVSVLYPSLAVRTWALLVVPILVGGFNLFR